MNGPFPHAPLLHRSSVRPTLSKRRRSRPALVTPRRQSDNDKTRVSSINKRRVTPVPGDVIPSRRGGKASLGRAELELRSGAGTGPHWVARSNLSPARAEGRNSIARRSVPTGRIGRDWACLPCLEPPRGRAVRQRHDEPRATPLNDPASQRNQRRHDAFRPSNPSVDSRRISPSRDRTIGGRAVPPSHAQTTLLRRTSHKKRYFLRRAARRRSSPSTAPLVTRLRALMRGLSAPAFGASSGRKPGGSTYHLPLARSASVWPAFLSSVALTRDA